MFMDARQGRIDLATYRIAYRDRLYARGLDLVQPGKLRATIWWTAGERTLEVTDGDTICCACSRTKAAAGECHRVWAAEALARAGWRIILDGEELKP
jgi:hypothetical protein